MPTPPTDTNKTSRWRPIEEAPSHVELLLAAKPKGHLWWKFGIGGFSDWGEGKILLHWVWAFEPTHFKQLDAPDGGPCCQTEYRERKEHVEQ